MSIQQRAPQPPRINQPAQLWNPRQTPPGNEVAPVIPDVDSSDWYATVDEWVGDTVGVVVAQWPQVGPSGLAFDDDGRLYWFKAAALQSRVDEFRSSVGQIVRVLRVGDAFWVRGEPGSLKDWVEIRDVTASARSQAKLAAATVAVGDLDPTPYLDSPAILADDSDTGARPPEITARPTV